MIHFKDDSAYRMATIAAPIFAAMRAHDGWDESTDEYLIEVSLRHAAEILEDAAKWIEEHPHRVDTRL